MSLVRVLSRRPGVTSFSPVHRFGFVVVCGVVLAAGFAGDWQAPPPGAAAGRVSAYLAAATAPNAVNLHRVNWRAVSLPGRVCGLRHPVRLRGGKARISSRLVVEAGWHRVVYGDIDGDGRNEAALSVGCTNGGGTADGVLSYSVVVFREDAGSPAAIGILRPRHQARGLPATLLEASIDFGRVIGREAFYGPNDGTCCPSGRAQTIWTYRRGTLRLASTRVTTKPD